MNSCLYECRVTHARISPKKHRFSNGLFLFYLDLDEICDGRIPSRFVAVSGGRRAPYELRVSDHLEFGHKTIRENLLEYLKRNGIALEDGKIMLLTQLRTFGYVFNPVSFYFCFDRSGRPVCAVAEVGNTFGEMKPYLLGPAHLKAGRFEAEAVKHFYISPFTDLEAWLDFRVAIPSETLETVVDVKRGGQKFFFSALTGRRRPLTDRALLGLTLRYPWVTFQTIAMIHWHAFRLWLKRVPYFRKEDRPDLQKDVHRPYVKSQ